MAWNEDRRGTRVEEWNITDLTQFLLPGANDRGMAFASMSNVITHSTQSMTRDDAGDAAMYLKSVARDAVASVSTSSVAALRKRTGR